MNFKHTHVSETEKRTSWNEVLIENSHWIRQVLRNRLGNGEEVEEVFQDVSLAVARADVVPSELDNACAWLYRVTIRQVLQYRRRTGRYRKLMRSTMQRGGVPEVEEVDPLIVLIQEERIIALREALSHLNEVDREILLLKYSENWTYQELADKLGVSTNTIEHRLVKAKKRLRKLLTNIEGGTIK